MKLGDLIAVNGVLYEYGGIETNLHKVYVVDIDEEGNLIFTHNSWYLTDEELSDRGIKLTQIQQVGLVKHILRQKYNLTEKEISDAAEDLVYHMFSLTRIPLVEELPMYITFYMDR